MRSTFGSLEIAKRSLFVHQAALSTTGHNIANANTQGYSRQAVNFVAARPLEAVGMQRTTIPGQMGQSVEFTSIERIRERFLDDQFLNENKALGEWTVRQDTLEKLEKIFNEPSDVGIRQTIEGFWNAWQELTKNPDSMTNRVLVKERTIAMTDAINHAARKLDELSADLTSNVETQAHRIDSLLDQVSRLNYEIFRVEGLGNDANDLRDQRDLIVDDLSRMINVTVVEEPSGYVLSMGTTNLVSGIQKLVQVTPDYLEDAYGGDLQSGEVFGGIMARDQYVTAYRNELNEMVKLLVDGGNATVTLPAGTMLPDGVTVTGPNGESLSGTLEHDVEVVVSGLNGLHTYGYDMYGNPGGAFFEITPGNEAATFRLSQAIIDDVFRIAAANRTYVDDNGDTKVVQGSNELALLIAGLKNKKMEHANGQTGTLDDFFRSTITKLGIEGQEARRQMTNQLVLVQHVEARRQSVSGVSLDEEMAHMIKFQHAYNAAARAMTVYDEILDKVINGMGVVGR